MIALKQWNKWLNNADRKTNDVKTKPTPGYPREILPEDFIKERGETITEVAKKLGIARANLPAIEN